MVENYEYDEFAIEIFGNLAEKFFKTPNKNIREEVYNLFNDMSLEGRQLKSAYENYILKNYLENVKNNPFVDETLKKNMEEYLQETYSIFVALPDIGLRSIFLKNTKIIEDFCPETIYRTDSWGKDDTKKETVIEIYNKELEKIELDKICLNDEYSGEIERDQINRLMYFLISNVGTEDTKIQQYQENYLKKIITRFEEAIEVGSLEIVLRPNETEFMATYISDWMLKSRLKQLGYNKDDLKNYVEVYSGGETAKGLTVGDNHIYIKTSTFIPELVKTICHETEHTIQNLESKKNPKSKIGLDEAINSVLRAHYVLGKGFDNYQENYRVEEIEKDAEKMGNYYSKILMGKLGMKQSLECLRGSEKLSKIANQEVYGYKKDETGKVYTREEFLFYSFGEALKENTEFMMNTYPPLELICTKDGKLRSFEDIISREFKINEPDKSIALEDLCKYYVSIGELSNLDLTLFPEETQANIASRLISILSSENTQITQMNEQNEVLSGIFEKEDDKMPLDIEDQNKVYVEEFHLRISKHIMNFMNRNYQHLMDLQNKGKFSSIIDMSYYDYNASVFGKDGRYKNLICTNLGEIDTLTQASIEAKKQKDISDKKNTEKFEESDIEHSFEELIQETRLSDFTKATKSIKFITNTLEHNANEMEENDVPK